MSEIYERPHLKHSEENCPILGLTFNIAVYLFAVVGKFQPYSNPTEPRDAYVDDTFSLHCPTHALSQKVKYNWLYEGADRRHSLPPSKNYFVTNNGTLHFSMLGENDIKFINDNGGILCEQLAEPVGSVTQSRQSHRITLTKKIRSGGTVIMFNIYNHLHLGGKF